MAVWSSVSVAALEYSRIDAEFYRPTYLAELESWQRLAETVGVAKLGKIIAEPVRTGRTPTLRTIKGDEDCIRFIKTDTVREGAIDFNKSALLPSRVVGVKDHISDDSIVMTIIGATPEIVGRTAIVRPTDPACVTNQNVAVIRTKSTFDPYFLTAYFQTKWGRDQVWRHSRRTEQVNLNCREVERILVPNPHIAIQESIGQIVRDSFEAADLSVRLYQDAELLIEKELGLDKLEFKKTTGYVVQFSDVMAERRANAEYFSPVVTKLLASKLFAGGKQLTDYFSIFRGKTPTRYTKSGISVLKTKGIRTPSIDLNRVGDFAQSEVGLMEVDEGDLILASMGVGSLGRMSYAHKLPRKLVIDGTLRILRRRSTAPSSIGVAQMLFLSSRAGQELIYRGIVGSTGIISLPDSFLSRIPLPEIDQDLCEELTRLVHASIDAKTLSKQLLDMGRARVEQLIEEAVNP